MICFPQKATDFFKTPSFLYIYIPPKKKKTHSPLTTLKIYKVKTPCCWEMRIEKKREKMKSSRISPQMSFFNKYAEFKSLHLFNLISLFSLFITTSSCMSCHFSFRRVPSDSDRSPFLKIQSYGVPTVPIQACVSASIHPYLWKSRG